MKNNSDRSLPIAFSLRILAIFVGMLMLSSCALTGPTHSLEPVVIYQNRTERSPERIIGSGTMYPEKKTWYVVTIGSIFSAKELGTDSAQFSVQRVLRRPGESDNVRYPIESMVTARNLGGGNDKSDVALCRLGKRNVAILCFKETEERLATVPQKFKFFPYKRTDMITSLATGGDVRAVGFAASPSQAFPYRVILWKGDNAERGTGFVDEHSVWLFQYKEMLGPETLSEEERVKLGYPKNAPLAILIGSHKYL